MRYFWLPDRRTILSSILLAMSAPSGLSAHFVWVSLVPWLFALQDPNKSRRKFYAFSQSLWLSFFFGLFVFHFIAKGLEAYFSLSPLIAFAAVLPFFFVHQWQWLIFGPLFGKYLRVSPSSMSPLLIISFIVGTGFLYTALDGFALKVFSDSLGHAFANSAVFAQAADLGGVAVLTFAAVTTNVAIWVTLKCYLSSRTHGHTFKISLAMALALILSLGGYGIYRLKVVRENMAASDIKINFLVIQPNLETTLKAKALSGDSGARDNVVGRYLAESAANVTAKTDFVVWPETAYPAAFRGERGFDASRRDKRVEEFVHDTKIPLIFGSHDFNPRKQQDFNAITFLDENGRTAFYHKSLLLPFGEVWPGETTVPWLKKSFTEQASFSRGEGPTAFTLKTKELSFEAAAIICYEAISSPYVIASANLGVQMLINVTDDSWFTPSNGPELHLALARFASIETRLPQLRATNSGISALISPDGALVGMTAQNTKATPHYEVGLIAPIPTHAKKWGNWFWKASGIISLLCFWIISRSKDRLKTRQPPALNPNDLF